MLDQTTGRCAMPPSNRTEKRRNLTGRSLVSKTKSKGGSHAYGHGQMPANRTRDSHQHQDRLRQLSAQPSVFRAHQLPICHIDHTWFAREAWVDEPSALA